MCVSTHLLISAAGAVKGTKHGTPLMAFLSSFKSSGKLACLNIVQVPTQVWFLWSITNHSFLLIFFM